MEVFVSLKKISMTVIQDTRERLIYVDIDKFISHAKTLFDFSTKEMKIVGEYFPKQHVQPVS
jgi:hypothetical protein